MGSWGIIINEGSFKCMVMKCTGVVVKVVLCFCIQIDEFWTSSFVPDQLTTMQNVFDVCAFSIINLGQCWEPGSVWDNPGMSKLYNLMAQISPESESVLWLKHKVPLSWILISPALLMKILSSESLRSSKNSFLPDIVMEYKYNVFNAILMDSMSKQVLIGVGISY